MGRCSRGSFSQTRELYLEGVSCDVVHCSLVCATEDSEKCMLECTCCSDLGLVLLHINVWLFHVQMDMTFQANDWC
jgi:hypothetical protein